MPSFHSFTIADIYVQRIAKARQGCVTTFSGSGDAAFRIIVRARSVLAARMAVVAADAQDGDNGDSQGDDDAKGPC